MTLLRQAVGALIVLLGASLVYVAYASPDGDGSTRFYVGLFGLFLMTFGLCVIWYPEEAKEIIHRWPFI